MAIHECSPSPLLEDIVAGAVDSRGLPAKRSTSGGWRSTYFIIGTEVAERFAYFGIEANLVNYLTGRLGQSTATAAKNVNTWFGISTLLPLLGAVVADSYICRCRSIVFASLLYILGLSMQTMSAVFSFHSHNGCQNREDIKPCSPSRIQIIFFFLSLYIVAIAEGGHKPCTLAFGGDQFDEHHPEQCRPKSSYFNWWMFCLCIGISVGALTLSFIKENLNWVLGIGIPCIVMVLALLLFLLGTGIYRYSIKRDVKIINPFIGISKVFVEAVRNLKISLSSAKSILFYFVVSVMWLINIPTSYLCASTTMHKWFDGTPHSTMS